MLTIALPKGRIADETLDRFEKAFGEKFVFEDRKLILLACVTTVLCLLGIALYNFYIIRYLIIVLMAVLSIVFYKKYKTAKKN